MESNLALAFVNETHCDIETAYAYLQSNCYDLNTALESWQFLNSENKEEFEKHEDIFERNDVKKLSRGISRATDNVNLVSRARCEIAQNFKKNPCFKMDRYFIDTPEFTFTLPDLSVYSDEFRKFLEKDLIENSTLVSLEQSGRLNWWAENGLCQRLWPLATTGDGNCLLHAASLAMWGFHDRLLTLRRALHTYLECSEHKTPLYRRWRWQQTKLNEQSGFVYSEAEWAKEWQNIVNMASTEPRRNGCVSNSTTSNGCGELINIQSEEVKVNHHQMNQSQPSPPPPAPPALSSASTYESLEEIHVLALAHVLRRPIVVVADIMLRDMNNEPFAPIPFGGVYLPLECSSKECHRSPLCLTYDMAHFSALVAMENLEKTNRDRERERDRDRPCAIVPLTDSDGILLPLQFAVDPGPLYVWSETHEQAYINSLIPNEKEQIAHLKEYLDVVDISDNTNTITATGTTSALDIDSEDEIEKRFTEVTDLSDTDNTLFGNKNRAAKQLQSVARQFGSIGKSMSKKLKKNFGSIAKATVKTKKPDHYRSRILCAEIHTKRHEYQEEMIKNYLQFAEKRFAQEQKQKFIVNGSGSSPENLRLQEQALLEGPLKCINTNCDSYGTVLTSYMCDKCYEMQRNEELSKINVDSNRYGTGRSKFYRESDIDSYDAVKNLPVAKSNFNTDRTLYLSKSTFYCDTGESFDTIEQNRDCDSKNTINSSNHPHPHPHHQLSNDCDKEQNSHSPPHSIQNNDHDKDQTKIQDNNANKAGADKLLSDIHVSKFDFGNINENLNFNPDSQYKSAVSNNHLGGDSLQFFMNKKKLRDQLMKQIETGKNDNNINFSSNHLSQSQSYDMNDNTNASRIQVSNYENQKDKDVARPAVLSSNVSYSLSRKYPDYELSTVDERPKDFETQATGMNCTPMQHCKTNHCPNFASAHTDFYCSKCCKKREIDGIII